MNDPRRDEDYTQVVSTGRLGTGEKRGRDFYTVSRMPVYTGFTAVIGITVSCSIVFAW